MDYFFSFVVACLFGACTLVVGVRNPIHSILILILVFILGSILLFMLQVEYFAILFMIVYVGAIVVLFLFIVMMLEIKMINVVERFGDLFSFRNLLLAFILLEILLLTSTDLFDLYPLIIFKENPDNYLYFKETNLYVDYSKLIQPVDHMRGLGGVLFTEYKSTLLIAGLLLFLSMIGSIVMTLEEKSLQMVKGQNANQQSLRHPTLLLKAFHKSFIF